MRLKGRAARTPVNAAMIAAASAQRIPIVLSVMESTVPADAHRHDTHHRDEYARHHARVQALYVS